MPERVPSTALEARAENDEAFMGNDNAGVKIRKGKVSEWKKIGSERGKLGGERRLRSRIDGAPGGVIACSSAYAER
jgi:hypothetical protein